MHVGDERRTGRWDAAEDDVLRRAVAEEGTRWKAVASRVPGRTARQVGKGAMGRMGLAIVRQTACTSSSACFACHELAGAPSSWTQRHSRWH